MNKSSPSRFGLSMVTGLSLVYLLYRANRPRSRIDRANKASRKSVKVLNNTINDIRDELQTAARDLRNQFNYVTR